MSDEPSRPSKRRRWRIVLGVAIAAISTWLAYVLFAPSPVATLEAELDRLDPGWRWSDLERQRASIADGENAALVMLDAAVLLPRGWPGQAPGTPQSDGPEVSDITADAAGLLPPLLPDSHMTSQLHEAMDQAEKALAKANSLTDYCRGRFPNRIDPGNTFAGNRDYGAEARLIASMLQAGVSWRLAQKDPDGAVVCCRNLLAAARAFGDEGTMIHQLARLAIATGAVRSLERLLAQGEYSDATLAALQQLAAEARRAGSLVNVLRWERAYQHELLNAMTANRSSSSARGPPNLWGQMKEAFSRDAVRHQMSKAALIKNHARILDYATTLIEWLKQPTPANEKRLAEFAEQAHDTAHQSDYDAMLFVQVTISWEKFVERWLRNEAQFASVEAAIAAERYRLKHGEWPKTLEQLTPEFLAAVPADPYLPGGSLRSKRVADGLLIYSVGPDRQDDGGNLLRVGRPWRGKDIGVQLWDPARRRQGAAETTP